MTEQLGAILVRLRQDKGYSQLRVAERLCAVSGVTTVTRHEVSRWERQERIPSAFWLRWLAEALEVSVYELEAAAGVTWKQARAPVRARSAAPASGNSRSMAAPGLRTVQRTRPAANPPSAPANGGDPLSRVTIEFEHQATSVRLSATYDNPQRALSALSAFRSMVGVDEPAAPQPAAGTAQDPMGRYPRGLGVSAPAP